MTKVSSVSDLSMRLNSITLSNFRCFEDITISFESKLTVIVAVNGSGKTTVLDAVRIALWPYLKSFDLAHTGFNDPANSITIDDVTKAVVGENGWARLLPAQIRACGNVLGVKRWTRCREKETARSKTLDNTATKDLLKKSKDVQTRARNPEDQKFELPVLGYYGTGRLWSNKKEKKQTENRTSIDNARIRTYGYMDCLDPASSYRAFEKWFKKILTSHTAEIAKIIKKDGRLSMDYNTSFSDEISVIQQAVDTALKSTEFRTIDLDYLSDSLEMYNIKSGVSLKVDQLSDGIRNMVGMVADIAYRCYKLNPHLGARAALDAKGIVMIDEVDMHLHPSWQQLVIGQLLEAFPNIQFIVTTHSPQVLTTVPNECIRVLHEITDEDGQLRMTVTTPTEQTRGSASHEVLAGVMETHARPDLLETKQLTEYKALIQQNLHRTDQALVLRQRLDTHFGSTHPLMKECDRLIRLVEFKRGLAERGGSNA